MTDRTYDGIRYLDRGEGLEDYDRYRVFLDHWTPLAVALKDMYDGVALRGDTRCLSVYGDQGSGKTIFAKKLSGDYAASRGSDVAAFDPNNLWHKMAGGRRSSIELVREATSQSNIFLIEHDKEWVSKAESWLNGQEGRTCLIVADNAERAYFRQGLVEMSDYEFAERGNSSTTFKLAAERFVDKCRNKLRGCVIVVLTNSMDFLIPFQSEVELQHAGMMIIEDLPFPDATSKETIVRVNTNRLNSVSYWHCLDKAGPDEKERVHTALSGADTFPASFAAVDRAVKTAAWNRIGRPARKCVLDLLVFYKHGGPVSWNPDNLAEGAEVEFADDWFGVYRYKDKWAQECLDDKLGAKLLESEWNLRVILLGDVFVRCLISGSHDALCKEVLDTLQAYHTPGTWQKTKDAWVTALSGLRARVETAATNTPNSTTFWAAGQRRSAQYEAALKRLYPTYDTVGAGFLSYRPDLVLSEYIPCSVLASPSADKDSINNAIKRKAHVLEFTAQVDATAKSVIEYLAGKLTNYVEIVREQ